MEEILSNPHYTFVDVVGAFGNSRTRPVYLDGDELVLFAIGDVLFAKQRSTEANSTAQVSNQSNQSLAWGLGEEQLDQQLVDKVYHRLNQYTTWFVKSKLYFRIFFLEMKLLRHTKVTMSIRSGFINNLRGKKLDENLDPSQPDILIYEPNIENDHDFFNAHFVSCCNNNHHFQFLTL